MVLLSSVVRDRIGGPARCPRQLRDVQARRNNLARRAIAQVDSQAACILDCAFLKPDSQFGDLPLCDRELMVHHERIG